MSAISHIETITEGKEYNQHSLKIRLRGQGGGREKEVTGGSCVV